MKFLLLLSTALASAPLLLNISQPFTFQQTVSSAIYQVGGGGMRVNLLVQESLCQALLTARADNWPQWNGRRAVADQMDVAGWQFNSSVLVLNLPEVSTTRYVGVFLICARNRTEAEYTIELSAPHICPPQCLSCKAGACQCPKDFIGEDCRFKAISVDNGDSVDLKISAGWRLLYSKVSTAGNA